MALFGVEGSRRENTCIEGYKMLKKGRVVELVQK